MNHVQFISDYLFLLDLKYYYPALESFLVLGKQSTEYTQPVQWHEVTWL